MCICIIGTIWFLCNHTHMNHKCFMYCLGLLVIYPSIGFSAKTVSCSFRDSQNVDREFVLRRSGGDDNTFMDSKKKDTPVWNVMSDDDSKLILFREMEKTINKKDRSVYSIFFIDKKSGDFRFRNYIHTEYINTIRGDCRLK